MYPQNRVTVEKPGGYKDSDYEILFRAIEQKPKDPYFTLNPVPNRKTDSNNTSGISTDYIGMNYDYPEADYATRARIETAHKSWQLGLIWTLQNHPRVPEKIRDFYKSWGLARDEFTDTGNWPPQFYVREARRMVSDFVETEPAAAQPGPCAAQHRHGLLYARFAPRTAVRRRHGHVHNEGDVQETLRGIPYKIDYGSIVPHAKECENLLVPVCLSATHIAYGSIRMSRSS